jgi:general transcription factor 3C polypeptide 1
LLQQTDHFSYVLQLVQFAKEFLEDAGVPSNAMSTHSMELRPYIEEPIPKILPSSQLNNHRKIRHDFVLSKHEFVDSYWETLECCYLTAGLADPLSAFPGSSVPEVCHICCTSLTHRIITYHPPSMLNKCTSRLFVLPPTYIS